MSIERAAFWLKKIVALPAPDAPVRILNVCGGHERAIAHAGLRTAIPSWLKLIPGPGCPICVCPESDISLAIRIAFEPDTIIVSFGDMLRVPVSQPDNFSALNYSGKEISSISSLNHAKAVGADIRPIASPMDALRIAKQNPHKHTVFFAAGFETTMAPVAALALQHLNALLPANLSFLISGRRTWPIVKMLLSEKGEASIDGIVAPGHVATIMGADEWQFIPREFGLPAAIAGFSAEGILHACFSILYQQQQHRYCVDNCYPAAVNPEGNLTAQSVLDQCFSVEQALWRGIGMVEQSGFRLKPSFSGIDARVRFNALSDSNQSSDQSSNQYSDQCNKRECRCADIVMARRTPNQCRLFNKSCNPQHPFGPCMVSEEGACQIWWQTGAIHNP